MEYETREMQAGLVVVLRGEVDLESSPRARRTLLDSIGRCEHVVVDLSGVTYIDSSGIASLVEALQETRQRGKRFALAAVSVSALRVFELARLDRVFAIYATVEEGLAHGG
jgi:anti-sigma B factor antagonist